MHIDNIQRILKSPFWRNHVKGNPSYKCCKIVRETKDSCGFCSLYVFFDHRIEDELLRLIFGTCDRLVRGESLDGFRVIRDYNNHIIVFS